MFAKLCEMKKKINIYIYIYIYIYILMKFGVLTKYLISSIIWPYFEIKKKT